MFYEKKKVLMVVHSWGVGGVTTSTSNLANALYKRGYDVTIVITSNKIEEMNNLLPGIHFRFREEKQSKFWSKLPYFRNFWGSGMWSKRQTPKKLHKYFIGKEKFDIEIAQFFGRPLKTVYGSPNKQSKKIVWIHSDFSYGKNEGYLSCFKKKMNAIAAYHSFDAVICNSKGVKNSFEKIIGRSKNNFVVYNLNDIEGITKLSTAEVSVQKEKFTFVFVGRLSPEKGVMRLLEAVKRLNKDGLSFDCWIIGDGTERVQAEKYIQENQMSNVLMMGQQSNPYPYIKKADMLVLPSEAEAYGLSLAEALILHTPTLATDCVGPRDILNDGEYGLLVKNDEESLYQGMKSVLTDKEILDFYKEKAKERADFFQEERILAQIENILNIVD